ncbi:hypothetical protein L7F22_059549 [Adiantum nelumboides]|nr:hypothetical protein [Adiantum nelumboides]
MRMGILKAYLDKGDCILRSNTSPVDGYVSLGDEGFKGLWEREEHVEILDAKVIWEKLGRDPFECSPIVVLLPQSTSSQWEELDAIARATIRLHLGESNFFTIIDKTTALELWDSLCSTWDGKSASNKVFLMKKLLRLSMKEGSSVSSHLNEFNALYLQLTSKGLNFDDEMKPIFLLCSLPASWDTFNTVISNSTDGGKLAFGDVTSALLTKEI